MPLEPCPTCHRHHRADEAVCPFCRSTSPARATLLAGVTAAALTLSGCPDRSPPAPVYGAPPQPAPVQSATPAKPADPVLVAPPYGTPPANPPAPAYGAPPASTGG